MSVKAILAAGAVVTALGISSAIAVTNLATGTPVGNAYEIVSDETTIPQYSDLASATVECPVGSVATGGGYTVDFPFVNAFEAADDSVQSDGSGWQIRGNTSGSSVDVTVWAVCAPVL